MSTKQTILGLDLGTSSIGWALIACDPTPKTIIDMGVRIFPEGVDRAKGEKSLNQDRRDARSLRRQGYRRVRRKQKLLNALQDAELLPKQQERFDEIMLLNPYALRTKALDERMELYELGRALYHLGQRRGFKSNRKTDSDKEDGKVYDSISNIDKEIKDKQCRTLGEYLYSLDPHQERIRGRYTARRHYEQEFERIWNAQLPHHQKQLNVNNRKRIYEAIFDQRPLKIQKHLVGFCEFEPKRRRAAAATMLAQEFRLWQNLNNLKVTFSDGNERFLTDKERWTLGDKLATSKKMSWDQVRKALNFPERSTMFNLERTYKSGLMGNQSAAMLSSALGKKKWKAFGERKQEELVTDLLTILDEQGLLRRLRRHWRFDEETITKLLKVHLPKGYMHLSSKAMRNIVPHMKRAETEHNQGLNYADACKAAGYDHTKPQWERTHNTLLFPGKAARTKRRKGQEIIPNHLPEILQPHIEVGELRNPMVERALYQVRRVVNAIIRRYGKPDIIRVEMARELKANRRKREDIEKRNRANEKLNEEAKKRLQEYDSVIYAHPSRGDLIKYRLWEECEHVCPYTGKSISMDALFGSEPQFDIEHIIPYTRCLDDSYMNKTLCERTENAAKGKLTPAEFYAKNSDKYQEILARAKNLPYPKFKRFALDAIKDLDDFVSQQLKETQYIARQAVAFLSQLGIKVEPVKGGTTALLRHAWGIGSLLSDDGNKTRLDHRHHAVDALTVALTTRSAVRGLSTSYLRNGRLRTEEQRQPMPNLREQAINRLGQVVISHKPQRKLKGPLHEETLYGFSDEHDDKGNKLVTIRKSLTQLQPKDLNLIKDETIRNLAKEHLAKHGDMKTAFGQNPTTFYIPCKNGSSIPVNKVRLQYPLNVEEIAVGKRKRHVKTGSNHHMAIFCTQNNKGKEKWIGKVVTTLEAAQRRVNGGPIIDTVGKGGETFHMALHINDMVEMEHDGRRIICYLQKMGQNGQVFFRPHNDATEKAERTFQISKTPETMRKSGLRLLEVDVLGKF